VILLIAVSGGCDSVALFHSVLALTRESSLDSSMRYLYLDSETEPSVKSSTFRIPCELHVAHFNHEQRGKNSDQDEALVKQLCSKASVPFHRYSWSEISNDHAHNPNTSFSQDVARKWRRQKMTELLETLVACPNSGSNGVPSQRWGAILTAHHRDDAEETILLKLLRGAHLTNLAGMEDVSDGLELNSSENCPSIGYFTKPMLGVRKVDIVQYLTDHDLQWREDESNSESKYKRNKVRNQLIPLLSEIAGGEDALHVSFYFCVATFFQYSL
jgi:tRNA(Ile)-lysidine synthase